MLKNSQNIGEINPGKKRAKTIADNKQDGDSKLS